MMVATEADNKKRLIQVSLRCELVLNIYNK